MSPEDEYDIKESFHVMDEDKTGEISLETFYTLCLGLGYDVQRDQLEQKARSIRHHELHNNNRITIDMVLEILSKFPPRDRNNELEQAFRLLLVNAATALPNQSLVVTPQDLVSISNEMGEPLSLQQAEAIMPKGYWNQSDLNQMLSPPPYTY